MAASARVAVSRDHTAEPHDFSRCPPDKIAAEFLGVFGGKRFLHLMPRQSIRAKVLQEVDVHRAAFQFGSAPTTT